MKEAPRCKQQNKRVFFFAVYFQASLLPRKQWRIVDLHIYLREAVHSLR